MGKAKRKLKQTASSKWTDLQAKLLFPEQEEYELVRPCVVEEQPIRERAREVGKDPKTIKRKVQHFIQFGIPGLVPTTGRRPDDGRMLPLEVRQHILTLKAEYPPLTASEIATICDLKFDRASDYRTVQQVLHSDPLPKLTGRRFPLYRDEDTSDQRRHNVIQLHVEGWTVHHIAGYLGITRQTVHRTLNRWAAEGVWGLLDKPHDPLSRLKLDKLTLPMRAEITKLQANPGLGEFRLHAAIKQQLGLDISPRTCGRLLALHRDLYGLPKPAKSPHHPLPMPFEASQRHEIWSVDLRYIEQHQCHDHTGYAYAITIWDNYSRDIMASSLFRSQDLTAYLIVLHEALVRFGVPAVLVSDSGSIFLAKQAQQIYQTLGIRKEQIAKRQAWQNYAETSFNINRRLADADYAKAQSWEELCQVHAKYIKDYREQEHWAHRERPDGRRTPHDVLGWAHGREITSTQLHDAFTLHIGRRLDRFGNVRLQHWKLYVEAGLPKAPAEVWLNTDHDTVTIAFANTPLVQYPVRCTPKLPLLTEVGTPLLFHTAYQSSQRPLWNLTGMEWFPARYEKAAPSRRQKRGISPQRTLPWSP